MCDTKAIENDTVHRPWPLPRLPWIMVQSWQRQLFAHWPVPTDMVRRLVPEPLEIDRFANTAYIGITPFHIRHLRFRLLPPLPGASAFPELNLRTYVRHDGRPGVYFFSLDAASRLAVHAARATYRLPYFPAEMHIRENGNWIEYTSRRLAGGPAEFAARYQPASPPFQAERGSLDHFLIERYALYVVLRNGRVLRGDIHHRPWNLQRAVTEIGSNTLAAAHGIDLPNQTPLLHYSARQDSLIWPLTFTR